MIKIRNMVRIRNNLVLQICMQIIQIILIISIARSQSRKSNVNENLTKLNIHVIHVTRCKNYIKKKNGGFTK